jgi:hypothetical protein
LRQLRTALLLSPLVTGIGSATAQEAPALLLITIETIKRGSEMQYDAIERRLTELCVERGCPNDYLALESADPPTQVWWFVMYESQADVDRVAKAYASDTALLRDLEALTEQKKQFTDAPVSRLTTRRADLGGTDSWRLGELPFAAVATATQSGPEPRAGAVFDASDGTRFVLVAAAARAEADAAAAALGADARVFRVRPPWSKPAAAWRAANPELWSLR